MKLNDSDKFGKLIDKSKLIEGVFDLGNVLLNFADIDITNKKFINCIIKNGDFTGDIFTGCEFKNVEFEYCYLNSVSFINCQFDDCRLRDGTQDGIHFIDCNIKKPVSISDNPNTKEMTSGEADKFLKRITLAKGGLKQ